MGCWNKTCGLSNLHVTAGTPVYVFVLEKNKDYDHCYSTSLFSPLLLPFEADYDDYGSGENCGGVALPFIMKGLKDQLIEMDLGENEYHDIAVKKENFDDKMFFKAVHEDRMQIHSSTSTEPTQVYFTMFRRDVVDAILETRTIEEYVGDNKGTIAKWGDSKDYIRYKFSDIVADIKPMIEIVVAKVTGAKAAGEFMADYILYNGIDSLFGYRSENKAARWMRYDNHRYSRIVDMTTVLRKGIEAGTPEALDKLAEILEQHLKAIFIDSFMSSARKTWIPGGHEGSQSTSSGALKLLGKVVNDVIDKERAEWIEEMGEDAADEFLED